jgi:hypothetical protein
MQLKLYARAGHLMYFRGTRGGQIPRYIGRQTKLVPKEQQSELKAQATLRATKDPAVIDSDSEDGKLVIRRMTS